MTMPGPVVRVHVWVAGRVQGVFYRASTREMAIGHGLAGWVKNLPDGRVEAVFEGSADQVRQAVDWCRHGPSGARVERVDAQEEEARGETGFRVAW